MSERKLYELTDREVDLLKTALHFSKAPQNLKDDLTATLTPATVYDIGGDAIERMCKAFYEGGADKLDDMIRPRWDNLARFSPDIAQGYRERARAALAALLGQEGDND